MTDAMVTLNDSLLADDNTTTGTTLAPDNITMIICPRDEYQLKPDTIQYICNFYILTIITGVGLIGNTISYMVMRQESRESSSTFILKVLAAADNLVLVFTFFYFSLPTYYDNTGLALDYKKFFELFAENIFGILLWVSKTMSIYLTLLVTAERFYAVTWPLKAPFVCTLRNAKKGVAVVVVFSIIYNIPKYMYFPVFEYKNDTCLGVVPWAENQLPTIPKWYYYGYVLGMYLVLIYAIPLSTLSVLNILLVNALRKSSKMRQEMSTATKKQDRITEKVVGIVTAFIILESPAVVLNIVTVCFPEVLPFHVLLQYLAFTYMFSAINSVINFYIYIVLGERFRRRLLIMFGCREKQKADFSSIRNASTVSAVAGRMASTKLSETIATGDSEKVET